ncbi:MAG: SDR family oxidoreductase [Caldilineaceae bacterium]|nr:SDR family oxidoreductase [Caldilineaceae bacterium]MCB0094390.1 SDR family oxidoreductase [Caldilineaceae bacterium]MCB0139512.1 SDR family oxidoreductase [Caldilineaceae bacterium]
MDYVSSAFSVQDKVAIVTGSTGVLGGAMAHGLARAGAKVVIVGRRIERAEEVAQAIGRAGGQAMAAPGDVLSGEQLNQVRDQVLSQWGRIDILINAAGGNVPAATILPEQSFFDMPQPAFEQVMDLNLLGTVLPSQVFGQVMADQGAGSIINISSMAAQRILTRVVGYSAAKAAIDNFTRWLAVEAARKYGSGVRVNAIAPGFFIGEQNRRLLLNEDESLTERGQQIIQHTPMGRFGEADELVGTAIWLGSAASQFITGIVVPVDGGFSAFSGI